MRSLTTSFFWGAILSVGFHPTGVRLNFVSGDFQLKSAEVLMLSTSALPTLRMDPPRQPLDRAVAFHRTAVVNGWTDVIPISKPGLFRIQLQKAVFKKGDADTLVDLIFLNAIEFNERDLERGDRTITVATEPVLRIHVSDRTGLAASGRTVILSNAHECITLPTNDNGDVVLIAEAPAFTIELTPEDLSAYRLEVTRQGL